MVSLALLFTALAQSPPSPSHAPALSLKSLVLYENGVGYFERRGSIGFGSTAEIPLEAGQLDDALKSLVIVSEKGVASVEFAPPLTVEAARAMAGMHNDDESNLEGLLKSMQGVDVFATREGGAQVKGRVISVSQELGLPDKEGKRTAEPTLLLFGDGGLAKIPLTQLLAVKPVGNSVAQAWARAIGSAAKQPERERLLVRGSATGGTVAVGYTTEAPVWRTTYRLVMGPKARLQGFALVHNDSDEDWNGVKVSLASGRPTSFLFPLAGPRYGRRELVSPADGLDTSPQLSTREAQEHLRGSTEFGGVSGVGMGAGGMGGGHGSVSLSHMGTVGHGAGVGLGLSSAVLEGGPTALEPAAVSEAGDLFVYSVKEPVILAARKSALVPIIDGPTTAERVTIIESGAASSGLRLHNTTPLTLEQGTLSVFTDGAYAGETQLDRVKPNEVRVLKHGDDLDVQIDELSSAREEGPVRKARVAGAEGARVLELTRVDRVVHTVNLESRSATDKTLLLQLPAGNSRVVSGAEEDVRSPGQPRYARLTLPAHGAPHLKVIEEGAVTERIAADSLSTSRLDRLIAATTDAQAKQTLGAVRQEVALAEQAQAKLAELERHSAELEQALARVRENLTALGKTTAPAASQALGQRLLTLDDELSQVKHEREGLLDSAKKARSKLLLAQR